MVERSGPLGLSIGTTNLVAARVGDQPVSRRSVLTLSTDRAPQAGVSDSGEGVTLGGFVERVGDPVPLVASDGTAHAADALLVDALDAMVAAAGGPTPQLAIAVPAHWGASTLRAVRYALRVNPNLSRAGMPARLIPDAVASLTAMRVNPGLPPTGVVALLDFGGGGTSITLAAAATSFEPIDETTRHPDFSGEQIDQALMAHVLEGVAAAGGLDPAGTTAVESLGRLREECRQAKERLSCDAATDLAVELPGYSASVRVTRAELEELIEQPFVGVLDELEKALDRNRISWHDVSAVVTIGGGASIPFVTERLSEHSRAEVVTSPQPALDAAIGAALTAAFAADAEAATGLAPTLGVVAAAIPDLEAGDPDSETFRALAWSQDDGDDDVVPYTGPDSLVSYGSETAARPAVQYVAPTGPIETPRGAWQRLPLVAFVSASVLVLAAIGGVAYALTGSTSSVPSSEVRTAEPKPLTQQPVPSSIEPPAPPPPAPVTQEPPPPPPPPVTITETREVPPPPPVTVTRRYPTTTTTPPPPTTTETTPTTTETTPPPPTTTTPTMTTTTTNPMTTTYVTVPFIPVPIPIQVPNRGPEPTYPQQNPYQPQYPYQQQNPYQPRNPFQPYP